MSQIGLIHQAMRFFGVGIFNTIIDFSVFFVLVEVFSFGLVIANFIAFSVAVINSYFCNKKWTFSATNTKTTLIPQLPLFVMVSFVGVILSTTVLWLLSNYTAVWIAKILATFGIRQRPWRAGLVKVINSLAAPD